jgi:hypothetical protein
MRQEHAGAQGLELLAQCHLAGVCGKYAVSPMSRRARAVHASHWEPEQASVATIVIAEREKYWKSVAVLSLTR